MSRCFPYPPPGYTLSSARKEASIESIKLQRENPKDKEKRRETKEERKERKEKKRKEKEERRKERKERKERKDKSCIVEDHIGQKTHLESKDELFIHKKEDYIGHKIRLDSKDELVIQKREEAASDQFERSSLTEEHGLPDSLPVPSSSYDSTENNKKRKRHSSSADGSQGHGKTILIRLPSKWKSEFHSLANGQQPCSLSRQTTCSAQLNEDKKSARGRLETCNIEQGLNLRNSGKEICSTSGQSIDTFAPGKTGLSSLPKSVVNPMQGVEDLLGKLFPPPLQDASLYPDADSDWLFLSRSNVDERAQKRRISGSDGMPCFRSSGLGPRAEYLPEVDVYALPYVLPY